MKKKILIGLIIVILVVIGIFVAVQNTSKNNTEQTNNNVLTNEDNENDDTEYTNSSNTESSDKNTNNDKNSSNTTSNDTSTVDKSNTDTNDNIDIDAAAKADIAKTKDDAVKKLLDYYLGEGDSYAQNTTKVTLTKNSDNTITVRKTDDDSNIYYSNISPLSDNSTDGLIISIDSYNDADKSYTYSLKSYADVKSGNTDNVIGSGTIPEEGNVISNK